MQEGGDEYDRSGFGKPAIANPVTGPENGVGAIIGVVFLVIIVIVIAVIVVAIVAIFW